MLHICCVLIEIYALNVCFMHASECECCIHHLAQNEKVHVGHATTSERLVQDLCRPDRRTPMKVLVRKSFLFVETLSASHMQTNMQNLLQVYPYVHTYSHVNVYPVMPQNLLLDLRSCGSSR